jgi:hypothetical protein
MPENSTFDNCGENLSSYFRKCSYLLYARCIIYDIIHAPSISRVEAGSNTSTVALRFVGGDKKGSLESETVNMVASPTGLRPENDCAGEDQQ